MYNKCIKTIHERDPITIINAKRFKRCKSDLNQLTLHFCCIGIANPSMGTFHSTFFRSLFVDCFLFFVFIFFASCNAPFFPLLISDYIANFFFFSTNSLLSYHFLWSETSILLPINLIDLKLHQVPSALNIKCAMLRDVLSVCYIWCIKNDEKGFVLVTALKSFICWNAWCTQFDLRKLIQTSQDRARTKLLHVYVCMAQSASEHIPKPNEHSLFQFFSPFRIVSKKFNQFHLP